MEHYGLLDLQVAYTRLRARAAEMERALKKCEQHLDRRELPAQ